MNKSVARSALAALLLASSASMAATVTVVPSTLSPVVGENFTLTIQADVGNTFAATMGLWFDATKVSFVGGAGLGQWTVFTKNSPTTANPTVFDVEALTATAANPVLYDVAVLTFTSLATGAASIWINDDGGFCCGWFAARTAEYIPVTYVQAEVGGPSIPRPAYPSPPPAPPPPTPPPPKPKPTPPPPPPPPPLPPPLPPPPPPPPVPVPAAVWLFGSALGLMGWMRRKAGAAGNLT